MEIADWTKHAIDPSNQVLSKNTEMIEFGRFAADLVKAKPR